MKYKDKDEKAQWRLFTRCSKWTEVLGLYVHVQRNDGERILPKYSRSVGMQFIYRAKLCLVPISSTGNLQ